MNNWTLSSIFAFEVSLQTCYYVQSDISLIQWNWQLCQHTGPHLSHLKGYSMRLNQIDENVSMAHFCDAFKDRGMMHKYWGIHKCICIIIVDKYIVCMDLYHVQIAELKTYEWTERSVFLLATYQVSICFMKK